MKRKFLDIWRHSQRLGQSWWGQFAALMILLGKVMWGMWQWRDLTFGDTSSYYNKAMRHLEGQSLSLVFSPLYVSFYGWFGKWFGDAHAATVLHRMVILVLLSSSLLLLARALLPRSVAWLVAAWWVVLPVNWNALYEVHLFGFIPLALGCWMVGGRARRLSLSIGLALVWSGALLVRNEYALTVALLALCCALRELVGHKKEFGGRARLIARIAALALPSVLVTTLAVAAWHESWPGWKRLRAAFHDRHTLNMAQVYPFSYQQQHPEWTSSPWTAGGELMEAHFGKARITFSEAFRRNPQAIAGHVLWHLGLVPAGLQMGLFNCHFGPFSPDFTPPRQQPARSAVLSILLLALLAAGIACMWNCRTFFRRIFRSRRGWCWLALLCTLPPCLVAIITQRPRPSYIFPLSFFLMAFSGLCLYAVLRRLRLWRKFQAAFPLCIAGILLAASSEKSTAQLYEGQPLRQMYERLYPFRSHFQGSRVVFASLEFTSELESYLNVSKHRKQSIFTLDSTAEASAGTFQNALETHRVTVLYLGPADLAQESVAEWLRGEAAARWEILATYQRKSQHWMLLAREAPAAKKPGEERVGGQTKPQ